MTKESLRSETASPRTLAPLKNPVFRSIWLASQVSSFGWLMQTVAVSWLMATISTSDVMVALVQASSTLPAFLLSVFAGAIADSFSRRKVMIFGRGLIATAAGLLTLLLALDLASPWAILALTFLAGCGVAFSDPAWQASVGDIVDRREIPAAVTLISVGFNTIRSVGPAIGGVIVASFGPLMALALATIGNFAPIFAIWRSSWEVRTSILPREAMLTAIHDGIRFVAMSSDIKAAIGRGTLLGLAGISILALLPLFVRDQLRLGPVAYGILMAGFGSGAFLAGVFNSYLRKLLSQELLIKIACLLCAVCVATLGLSHSLIPAVMALSLGGAGWVIGWSGLGVSVQLASPRWVVGRTLSIYYALTYGGIAFGSWLWGAIAQNYSLPASLLLSSLILLLVGACGFLFPIRGAETSDLDPLEKFNAPELTLDLKPRSGPIVVKIEYRVTANNLEAFLIVMLERRRAQSRAGARHWNLQRDLQDTAHWIETFRTPTWTEYLRLNHRLTATDKGLDEQLFRLHSGDSPPRLTLTIERPVGVARKSRRQAGPLVPHP